MRIFNNLMSFFSKSNCVDIFEIPRLEKKETQNTLFERANIIKIDTLPNDLKNRVVSAAEPSSRSKLYRNIAIGAIFGLGLLYILYSLKPPSAVAITSGKPALHHANAAFHMSDNSGYAPL